MEAPVAALLWIAGVIGAVGTAVAVLAGARRWLAARWRRVDEFLEDWRGTPPRPGCPGRPGVPERLAALETALATVKSEVTPNHGGSLKDLVRAIDQRTRADEQLLEQHMTWHRNAGAIDPTARVLLTRPDQTT